MRAQHATRCCREAASSAGQSAHSADRSQVAISFYHYHFGLSLRHSPITVTSSIELQANTLRREWQRLTLCVLVSLGSVRRACGPVHTRRQISAPHTHTQTDAHTRTHPLPHRQHRGQTPPLLYVRQLYICLEARVRRAACPACMRPTIRLHTQHATQAPREQDTEHARACSLPLCHSTGGIPRSLEWASMLLYHLRVEPTTIYHQKVERTADTPWPVVRTLRNREYLLTGAHDSDPLECSAMVVNSMAMNSRLSILGTMAEDVEESAPISHLSRRIAVHRARGGRLELPVARNANLKAWSDLQRRKDE